MQVNEYKYYGGFTLKEAQIGKKYKAKCVQNDRGYTEGLTVGKVYDVEIIKGIFEPYCTFIGDNNKKGTGSVYRFEKVEEV